MTVRALLASCWLLIASVEAALPECPPGTPPTAGKCADRCNLAGYYTRETCKADSRCTWCYALSQYSAYAKCYNKENANLKQICDGSLPGCTCDAFGGSAQEAERSEGQRRLSESRAVGGGGGDDDEAKAARKKRKLERMAKMAEGGEDGGIEVEARDRRKKLDTPEAKEARRKIKLEAIKRELRRLAETEVRGKVS